MMCLVIIIISPSSRWQWDARQLTWLWEEMDWDSWASMCGWMALWPRWRAYFVKECSLIAFLFYFFRCKSVWCLICFHAGGRVRLRLAGRTEARQSISGNLQGGCCHTDSRANDRPAEDVSHCQSGHHSSIWRGRTSQVRTDWVLFP